jgi:hypothetical protein
MKKSFILNWKRIVLWSTHRSKALIFLDFLRHTSYPSEKKNISHPPQKLQVFFLEKHIMVTFSVMKDANAVVDIAFKRPEFMWFFETYMVVDFFKKIFEDQKKKNTSYLLTPHLTLLISPTTNATPLTNTPFESPCNALHCGTNSARSTDSHFWVPASWPCFSVVWKGGGKGVVDLVKSIRDVWCIRKRKKNYVEWYQCHRHFLLQDTLVADPKKQKK